MVQRLMEFHTAPEEQCGIPSHAEPLGPLGITSEMLLSDFDQKQSRNTTNNNSCGEINFSPNTLF